MSRFLIASLGVSLLSLGLVAGCDNKGGEFKKATDLKTAEHGHDHDHGHEEGPHHGALMEVGKEAAHLEVLVDDEGHTLHAYLLGPDAKAPLTTASAPLVLKVEGHGEVSVPAKPLTGEADGQTSHWELMDEKLVHALIDDGYVHGKTEVTVGGQKHLVDLDIHFEEDHDHAHGPGMAAEPAAK